MAAQIPSIASASDSEPRRLPGEAAFDPYDDRVIDNPYPYYAWLRENSPCHHVERLNIWVVSRHADIVAVCRNFGVFSSAGGQGIDWVDRPMMPMSDPPIHTRLRRIAQPFFTEQAIRALRPSIEARAEHLLTTCLEKGRIDFAKDFAVPLALGNIAELMGVPADDMPLLYDWAMHIIEEFEGGVSEQRLEPIEIKRREFITYLKAHLSRSQETLSGPTSVIGKLLFANAEEKLSRSEVMAFCVLLLVAGFETSSHSLSNGLHAFLTHPAELARLRKNHDLLPNAVEEMFRYDTAAQSLFRNTLSPARVADTDVPANVKVMVLFASANRDPRKFERPDDFWIERKPDHLAFGHGIHYCLGAPLARLTLRIGWERLLARTHHIEQTGPATREGKVLFRGLASLPVELKAF